MLTILAFTASFAMLNFSLKTLPLGTAYAVWTGIGTVGTAIVGIVYFKEPFTAVRVFCIGVIVAGTIGLKLVSKH